VTGSFEDRDLADQIALMHVESKCTTEKAKYLIAQLDRVPRERRAKIATYVDLVCAAEVAADVLGMEAYRHPGAGMSNSGAPRYWDDPSDPLNAK
jgi:hypothetical protein